MVFIPSKEEMERFKTKLLSITSLLNLLYVVSVLFEIRKSDIVELRSLRVIPISITDLTSF